MKRKNSRGSDTQRLAVAVVIASFYQCLQKRMAGNGWWRAGAECGGSGGVLLGVESAEVGVRKP